MLVRAQGELDSFLIEISAIILAKKDEDGKSFIVDKILDKTGMKGTGARPAPLLCGLRAGTRMAVWGEAMCLDARALPGGAH